MTSRREKKKSRRIASFVCNVFVSVVLTSNARERGRGALGDSYSDTGAGSVDGNGSTAVAYLAALFVSLLPSRGHQELEFRRKRRPERQGVRVRMRPAVAEFDISAGRTAIRSRWRGSFEPLLRNEMQTQLVDLRRRRTSRSRRRLLRRRLVPCHRATRRAHITVGTIAGACRVSHKGGPPR
jgi:hypothetical protein